MSRNAPKIVTDIPGPRSREILGRLDGVLYPGTAHDLAPFVIARKDGYTVTDVDGNVFWDFVSASASVPLGAGRGDILDPSLEALRRFGNEDTHGLAHDLVLPLAQRLLAVAPANLSRVDIALNGTEAVETAVRFMRRATGRPIVIGFLGGYHGEAGTAGAIGAETSDLSFGYRALMPGFVHVPYPNPYRTPFTARPGGTGDGTVDYLRDHLLFHAIDPREVAGFVIEPVLGSGGASRRRTTSAALVETLQRARPPALRRRGEDGVRAHGHAVRRRAVGRRARSLCLGKAMGGGVMPIGAVLGPSARWGSRASRPVRRGRGSRPRARRRSPRSTPSSGSRSWRTCARWKRRPAPASRHCSSVTRRSATSGRWGASRRSSS
jgi:4-aminobutyrate aminotransferase-like enzyme